MDDQASAESTARPCFDALATWYDDFTSADDYMRFGDLIGQLARSSGVRDGSFALDVACGTGKSTYQLRRLGYIVDGCDISEEMLVRARGKPELAGVRFFWADVRRHIGAGRTYDLATCLDDAVNFLLYADEVAAFFTEVSRALVPRGLFIFDCNSLMCYRTSYAETRVEENSNAYFVWRGSAGLDFAAGDMAKADLFILPRTAESAWVSSPHLQRHHPVEVIEDALGKAGMELEATWGLKRGGIIERNINENVHHKLIHVARRRT
jgi:ubiquinone/menaquinone biosynthesis C-methylase UbiE